jgi:hypothetical protein
MKKLILSIITLLSLNSVKAQFDPFHLDESLLNTKISVLNDYPTGIDASTALGFFNYVGRNSTLNIVNYKNLYKSKRTQSGITNCRATKFIDAYIEIDLTPSMDIIWGPNNSDNQNNTFELYKRMLNELGIADPDFAFITSFSVEYAGQSLGNYHYPNIAKIKINYKKAIEWDCEFYGI